MCSALLPLVIYKTNLPSWRGKEREKGDRFVGSGINLSRRLSAYYSEVNIDNQLIRGISAICRAIKNMVVLTLNWISLSIVNLRIY
jgi:hypothetical protein